MRRLTLFPAENLKIKERGALRPGWFADIAVFDPAKIQDHATYDKPHQYATGVRHLFVNGEAARAVDDAEPDVQRHVRVRAVRPRRRDGRRGAPRRGPPRGRNRPWPTPDQGAG